jgi:hypothetical protein
LRGQFRGRCDAASSSFFCGCFQALDPLPDPPPLSPLEGVRIAPRLPFFSRGNLLRSGPVPGKQLCRQRVDLGARDETGPDATHTSAPQIGLAAAAIPTQITASLTVFILHPVEEYLFLR